MTITPSSAAAPSVTVTTASTEPSPRSISSAPVPGFGNTSNQAAPGPPPSVMVFDSENGSPPPRVAPQTRASLLVSSMSGWGSVCSHFPNIGVSETGITRDTDSTTVTFTKRSLQTRFVSSYDVNLG
ncbi:hypothetical protein C8J57DRAFT_1259343 [Mycena rebaudengoi]|nr:hypothetical protein C8J57DRAFT_1259343 [Mycena rebaudengoi]